MPTVSPRPLSADERGLVEWLLKHGSAQAMSFLSQLDSLRVVAACDCGCPTVDFAPVGESSRFASGSVLLADFQGVTTAGVVVGVILHARRRAEGAPLELSELEVYPLADQNTPFGLPVIASLGDPGPL